jgi:hypothetical protein
VASAAGLARRVWPLCHTLHCAASIWTLPNIFGTPLACGVWAPMAPQWGDYCSHVIGYCCSQLGAGGGPELSQACDRVGTVRASNRGVSNETRFTLNAIALVTLILVVLASVVGSLVCAMQPGNGGAIVLTMLSACIGYGLICEAVEQTARSEWAHPVARR